jgi:bifunctional DNA-binding transcriptional regulator/antitoxin component of YhaV-PrlF toxin-antitoxin module
MTTFRGTVKDGQLVFPAEVAEHLGLREGTPWKSSRPR